MEDGQPFLVCVPAQYTPHLFHAKNFGDVSWSLVANDFGGMKKRGNGMCVEKLV